MFSSPEFVVSLNVKFEREKRSTLLEFCSARPILDIGQQQNDYIVTELDLLGVNLPLQKTD